MSRVASPRPSWLRAAFVLLALLGTVLAPSVSAEAAPAPAPPAAVSAVSTELTGEAHQDTADSALRVPTRRPAPLTARAAGHRDPEPRHPEHRPHLGLPAPRSVVLRC
ncbi:hypothetical protein ACGFSB_08310 [Streptomyces sp. NPDC048441]|uniref:hypothetical protein n=1 Tax=Streptomyces sp. NPDC048441 TaxID=3365552 RepID=UPI0037162AEF